MKKKSSIIFEGKNYDCKIESNDEQNINIIVEDENMPKYNGNISLKDIYKAFPLFNDYTMKDIFANLEDLKDDKFQIIKEENKFKLNILIKVLKKEKPLIIDIAEVTQSKNDIIQLLIKKVQSNEKKIACLEKEVETLLKEHLNNIIINENKNNIIIGEININKDDINEYIRIINSFENVKRNIQNHKFEEEGDKCKNEKEIKDNIEIKINDEIIEFTYKYQFKKEGKYKIEYLFKNNLTNTCCMFSYCDLLTNLNLSNFDTQNVTNMEGMFGKCKSLTNLNLSNFNTQNVTNMDIMFNDCVSLTNLNLSNFNTQNVSSMNRMFFGCKSLTNLNLSNFETRNTTDMGDMFGGCRSLTNLDLSNFNTQNVTDMQRMFGGCISLTNLNLSNFETQNALLYDIFGGCRKLTKKDIITKDEKILKECKNK